MKQVNNPLGAVKSPQRSALEKANLIGLMENFNMQAIATMYNTSVTTVHSVLTNQLTKRSIGQVHYVDEFTKEVYSQSSGAWMNSKERKAILNHNKYNNSESTPVFYFKDGLSDDK
jgi:hypothetical protein